MVLRRLSPHRVALLAGLVVLAAYVPLAGSALQRDLEGQLIDLRLALRPEAPPAEDVVVVLIDEASIQEIGRWPWSRGVMARLLAALDDLGPRVIGLDFLFVEAEQEAIPAAWLEQLRQLLLSSKERGFGVDLAELDRVLRRFLGSVPGDDDLARALDSAGNVVVPFAVELDGPATTAGAPAPPHVTDNAFRITRTDAGGAGLPEAQELLAPIPLIGEAAAGMGHAAIGVEPDGVARFEYPAIAHLELQYPSFALEIARQALAVDRSEVRLDIGHGVRLGEVRVPIDEAGRMLVNDRGPGRFRTVSAAEVMRGDAEPAWFDDEVVLVGGAAAGIGGTVTTSFAPGVPGVVRHATVIDSILRDDFIERSNRRAVIVDLATLALSTLLLGAAGARLGTVATALTAGGLLLLVAAGNLALFLAAGIWLNLALPLLGIGAVAALVIGHKYVVGLREERALRRAFQHYVDPELVDQVVADPSLLRLGGEEKELTVLFADIRNSTALATALGPAAFVEFLNDVFAAMTAVVFRHDGMLDKFMGDGMLVVFGALPARPDHAECACRAALAMQEVLPELRARWARPGFAPLEIGIGINTGPMIIGNMGSRERFDYTVIGDEASLGARLEAANKELRTRILISEATYRALEGRIAAREIDVVRFRGIARPVCLYEVRGLEPLAPEEARLIEMFHAGLAAHRAGDHRTAIAHFEQVLAMAPDDHPSRIYVERCRSAEASAATPGPMPERSAVRP